MKERINGGKLRGAVDVGGGRNSMRFKCVIELLSRFELWKFPTNFNFRSAAANRRY